MSEKLRLMLETLNGKDITILGHDNIDVDSFLSGILMSNLLTFLKIKNRFCILEKVKEDDTYEILNEFFAINSKKWQDVSEDENRVILLLDHFETTHKGRVIACIDHHPTSQEKSYDFMYVKNSCATAYMVYELMCKAGYPLTKREAKMVIVAMLVDTVSFRSTKTVKEEVEVAKSIAKKYNLNFEFLEKATMRLTPIGRMNISEIVSNGRKWYNYAGHKVGSSYVQVYGLPEEQVLNAWLAKVQEDLNSTESKMLVFVVFDLKNLMTYEYQVTKDGITLIKNKGILSRGKNIMPKIEAKFLS